MTFFKFQRATTDATGRDPPQGRQPPLRGAHSSVESALCGRLESGRSRGVSGLWGVSAHAGYSQRSLVPLYQM
ncbi:hypothetical protein GDO78_020807 [Eleutherodactylus coqui]|uniref:Uncharacterized protein n=1 Tax=Eleutherodactylus coqui TaxID=57060 RepID=A0A8J6BF91_ELECQ|nr:hypothetical protein GDO78_020807 [Eleutherodactylus coqui]